MRDRQVLKEFLCAFVHVKHSQLEVEHRLARNAKPKMSRLNNSSVHRANWHMKHAFAFDLTEFVPLTSEWRKLSTQVQVLAQWMDLRPSIVQCPTTRVGVPNEFETKQILNLAFLPVHSRD